MFALANPLFELAIGGTFRNNVCDGQRVLFVTVDALLLLRICCLPLCRVTVSVGDYLLNNVRGSPWPFVGSLYNRYCL